MSSLDFIGSFTFNFRKFVFSSFFEESYYFFDMRFQQRLRTMRATFVGLFVETGDIFSGKNILRSKTVS